MIMKENNYFGYNLRFLRKSYNLSQEALGAIIGRSGDAIGNWERETREPSNKDVQGLCKHFGLEPSDLMYRPLDKQTKSILSSRQRELLALTFLMNDKQLDSIISVAKAIVS